MNRQQFEYYLAAPAELSITQLAELEDLVKAFPYCQTLRLMIAKALSKDEDLHFESYLRMAAAYATDRTRLRQLILAEPVKQGISPALAVPVIPDDDRFQQLIAEMEKTIQDLKAQRERPLGVYDIEREFGTPAGRNDDVVAQQTGPAAVDRIGQFTQGEPPLKPPKVSFFDPLDIARKSMLEHDDLATETLALIYIEQGHYQRAIKIYQQLILKFPEKSSYFAAQIKNLEKEAGKS